MADIYVNSNAVGLNNGTSAANAYTSFSSALTAAAGDNVLVSHTHAQSIGSTAFTFSNGTIANPVKIYSVNHSASNALQTGATITCTGNCTLNGFIYTYGMTFKLSGASTFTIGNVASQRQTVEACTFKGEGTGGISFCGAAQIFVRSIDCIYDFTTATSVAPILALGANANAVVEIFGGTYNLRTSGLQTTAFSAPNRRALLEGVNINGTATNLVVGSTTPTGHMTLRRCKLPTYTNLVTAAISGAGHVFDLVIEDSAAGTISVPPIGFNLYHHIYGTMQSTLTRYRVGGADDGEQATPYSWEMASNANAIKIFNPLANPYWAPVAYLEANVPVVLTMYLAAGGTINNDDFGVELFGPTNAGSPTAQGYVTRSRVGLRTTPSVLSSDTSTWVGSGVTSVYKVELSYTPTLSGYVELRPMLYKPSTTLYVDPYVYVS